MDAAEAEALRELGRQVRMRRKQLGLTQIEAATRAGISNATWSPLERGKIRPVWRTAVAVSRVLGWPDDAFAAVLAPRVDTPQELVDLAAAERREVVDGLVSDAVAERLVADDGDAMGEAIPA
jgi:DNA-binding XRE family transcriptional regulator